uniref:hypothetical protein n=2 Tax=unclassified Paraflavitalea TaxID=2798305 RepID=UPI003D3565C3
SPPFGMLMPNRSYTAGSQFRYGFNGQEKDTEMNENITTALFWEYDSRTGRRWNLDCKPQIQTSPYSCLSNNPNSFSDVNGDTAVIEVNRHQTLKYVNGQWIDAKTRQAVHAGDKDKNGKDIFSQKTQSKMNDYEKLNSINEFSPVTSRINSCKNNIILNSGPVPNPNSGTIAGSGVNTIDYFNSINNGDLTPDINVYLAGEKSINPRLLENGKNSAVPSYIGMGHELGHVWHLLNPNSTLAEFSQLIGFNTGTSMSEINAMYWENVLRTHASLPLRLYYSINDQSNKPELNANVFFDGVKIIHRTKLQNGKIVGLSPEIVQSITLVGLSGRDQTKMERSVH